MCLLLLALISRLLNLDIVYIEGFEFCIHLMSLGVIVGAVLGLGLGLGVGLGVSVPPTSLLRSFREPV